MRHKRDNISLIVDVAELTSLVDRQSGLEDLLNDIVELVAGRLKADACSIYLYNEDREELVLRAARGLRKESVGKARLRITEGLTGYALRELRAVRVDDVRTDPRFKYDKSVGEEDYEAFLAVPIKKGIKRIGVITVQHRKSGHFGIYDLAAMKAIASQLSGAIESTGFLMSLREQEPQGEGLLKSSINGKGISHKIVQGRAYYIDRPVSDSLIAYHRLAEESQIRGCRSDDSGSSGCTELELAAFDKALEITVVQLERIQSSIDKSLEDVAGMIFTAHFLMLRDENFTGRMRAQISAGSKPDEAVKAVVSTYVGLFGSSDHPGIREKVQDVRDLEHRLLANLYDEHSDSADYSGNIIITDEIFPSELIKIWLQKAGGLALFGNGLTAHISILARSLDFPVLITGDHHIMDIPAGTDLILDPAGGLLHVNPSEEISLHYKNTSIEGMAEPAEVPDTTYTVDGTRVYVFANVNIIHDTIAAFRMKAEGIGLYRSEFPFIVKNEFPSEEEQYRLYSSIVDSCGDRECIFRTLDIGGDKMPNYVSMYNEANPFLGCRGIRFSLGHKEIFQDQIRAMLRAGYGRNLRIMFPMVSCLDEFLEASEFVRECMDSLSREGEPYNSNPGLGAMVELPSAVEVIDELAAAADFLSIGTNDLIMYTLAVDRTNERLSGMYKPFHPAILRIMKRIADGASRNGTELSVCGESATNPDFLKFLIGLGICKISVDPLEIAGVKAAAAVLDVAECREFAVKMLGARTVAEAEGFLS